MSASPPLSPQQLALLPHNDAGPTLLIVSWSLIASATVFLGLRIYCKLVGHRSLYWDDWVLVAAWIALVIDDALATYMVKGLGFGKHSWDLLPTLNIDKFFLVSNTRTVFTITAISWTKTAFAITLLRLTQGWTKRFIWFVIVSINIALGLSGLLAWVQCVPLAKAWTPSIPGKCINSNVLIEYAIFGGAYSAAMDFTLALLPWKIIWELQLNRAEKVGIAVAMSMGIFAAVVAIVKSLKLPELASPDMYNAVDLVIWDITEASVTMMAACIPVLRVLLRDVRSSSRRDQITSNPNSTQLFDRQSSNRVGDSILSPSDIWTPTSPGGNSLQELYFHADRPVYDSSRGDRLKDMAIVRYT